MGRPAGSAATSRTCATIPGGSTSRSRAGSYASTATARSFGASPAVVGAPQTPTPIGLFAVYELDAQPAANDFVGSWVIQLTAFSDVLDNYGGGPGRVAIHGRGGASLADPLGTARSHGCIRLDNGAVEWLARSVLPGTPVMIHA